MDNWNGTFEMIDPNLILVDHQYQRQEKPSLIEAIASNPIWEVFGTIVCFTRERPVGEDGQKRKVYYCVDGQQRLRGVLRTETPPKTVPVITFQLEGVREEAEVFVRINEYRKSLSALEKHQGKIVAKDPAALAITKVAESVGFTVGNQYNKFSDSRTIQAVGALNRVYNLIGEEGLEQTLVQARDAWPDDRAGIEASMLIAIGNLIAELSDNNGGYNRGQLTKKLASVSPATIHRKAESFRYDMGGSIQVNMRRAFKALCKV